MPYSSSESRKKWLSNPSNKRKHYEYIKKWKSEHPEKNRLYKHARRGRLVDARVEKYINKTLIINWESRICGICNLKIKDDYHIDHIIPISKGGAHAVSNLQLAHPFCNRSKFNKLTEELMVV